MISMFKYLARLVAKTLLALTIIFILPALAHLGVWSVQEHASSWRSADWSSADILPKKPAQDEAKIYVLTARTGGMKGAFATHSWIVIKPKGQASYDRYEVVGWGTPLRKNAYDADGKWYSNIPEINHEISGEKAERLIPQLEKAIANYPWRNRGDYTLWPGPNSNSFVAAVLQDVPELGAYTPNTAVGRDFPANRKWIGRHQNGAYFATLGGYIGIVIGGGRGFEINFLGLVAGFNPATWEIKIPAFGGYKLG